LINMEFWKSVKMSWTSVLDEIKKSEIEVKIEGIIEAQAVDEVKILSATELLSLALETGESDWEENDDD